MRPINKACSQNWGKEVLFMGSLGKAMLNILPDQEAASCHAQAFSNQGDRWFQTHFVASLCGAAPTLCPIDLRVANLD
jgi:hypothetical protein